MTRIGLAECAWVGVGGAIGSVLRYALHTLIYRASPDAALPWGTLGVNALGCLAIGVVAGWPGADSTLTHGVRLFLVVGIFGGFTTFSTFGIDTFQLLRAGDYGSAGLNVGRMGHGLGLQLTEPPSNMAGDLTALEPGMVMTIEPGMEYAPGRMLLHEENIVVTEDGAELLTRRAPRDMPIVSR